MKGRCHDSQIHRRLRRHDRTRGAHISYVLRARPRQLPRLPNPSTVKHAEPRQMTQPHTTNSPLALTPIPARSPGLYWVGVYLVERIYKDHPEPTPWFEYGELVCSPVIYQRIGLWPSCFPTASEAHEHASAMTPGLEDLNSHRAPLGKLTRQPMGQYKAMIFEQPNLPSFYPPSTPRHVEPATTGNQTNSS